ncbi:PREDICTED: uncharacterized protein LOC106815420 [Priapulus caudatus]|uniref:Uncharacterized protein LOC106815420 n=1 Tax=Priapulus caudatus TaxID=37621 RepID=A0ABM1ET44_PRICU|nr:PREDICTED: uncharacterized protein LOC106815420 [Priapulus caudatus]
MCVANDQMLMDDVAYLQQSFDEFRESIQEKQEQLINQTAEVTAAVQALREQSDLVLLFMNSGNAGDAISGNESFPEDGLPDEKMMIVMVKDGEMMGTDGRPIPGEIRLKAEEKLPGNETEGEEDDVMADEDLPCPEGQLYYMEKDAMNHSCYMVFKKNLTWYDASTACRVMGGALVSVETAEEHAAVMLYLADKYDGQTPALGYGHHYV